MNRESGIFISYRRQDSSGHAGRLRDNLRAAFGAQVFHDVDGIADGEVFEQVLEKALTACDVAVVIIGRTWLTCTDEQGHRRLDDPEDWVRIETRMLLSRNIRVIPVLVGGATIPRTADLPEDLRALAKRQSRELRDTAWDADVTALIERLREIVQPRHQHRTVSGAALTPHRGKIVAGSIELGRPRWILQQQFLGLPIQNQFKASPVGFWQDSPNCGHHRIVDPILVNSHYLSHNWM